MPRRTEVAFGYAADVVSPGGPLPNIHGPFTSLGVSPYGHTSDDWYTRVTVTGEPHFLWTDSSFGAGAALRLGVEHTSFANIYRRSPGTNRGRHGGTFPSRMGAYGEGGVGGYVQATYDTVGPFKVVTFGLGLSFRIPAAFDAMAPGL